jgi:hypothetical protein
MPTLDCRGRDKSFLDAIEQAKIPVEDQGLSDEI